MGSIRDDYRVKVFCGAIYSEEKVFEAAREMLEAHFGEADIEAGPFDFDFTDYYLEEMGGSLKRRFLSFRGLVSPLGCYKWKVFTNAVEKNFSSTSVPERGVNLDPGYLDLARVVLLSTKDYFHRVYLEGGIFAELTMYYQKGGYRFLPWTYPDYMTGDYLDFFHCARRSYQEEKKYA